MSAAKPKIAAIAEANIVRLEIDGNAAMTSAFSGKTPEQFAVNCANNINKALASAALAPANAPAAVKTETAPATAPVAPAAPAKVLVLPEGVTICLHGESVTPELLKTVSEFVGHEVVEVGDAEDTSDDDASAETEAARIAAGN